LGLAAELAVVSALEVLRLQPLHVAPISDRYGYDIETKAGPYRKWEVKGATLATSERFHLTRNEFDKAEDFADWILIQVVFNSAAIFAENVLASHVEKMRLLTSSQIRALAPPESPGFAWDISATFRPPLDAWSATSLTVPATFELPSFKALSERVASPVGTDGERVSSR
jgi:hypothetical protein